MKKCFSSLLASALFFISIVTSFGGFDHAFLWDPVTGIKDLGTLGQDSIARGVNDSGTVVGDYVTADGLTSRGFIWTAATGMVDIGLPGGEGDGATVVDCHCTAINSAGHVVGYARQADDKQVAFFWTPETGFTTLAHHTNSGDNGNTAYAINDLDEVTGNLWVSSTNFHAYIWSPIEHRANDLGGVDSSPYGSSGTGINNLSQIVGDFGTADEGGPFFWNKSHGVRLLGEIADALYTATTGVNDAREIIGSYGTDTETLGFYTAPGLGLRVLKGLGGSETYALAINQSGVIVGEASDGSGNKSPVIWTSPSASPEQIASEGGAFGINSLGQVVGFTYFQ